MNFLFAIIILVFVFAIIVGFITREHPNSNFKEEDSELGGGGKEEDGEIKTVEDKTIPSIKKRWHFDVQEDVSTTYVQKPAKKQYDPLYEETSIIGSNNQYLDAYEQLNISIFEKDLTEEKVKDAYEKLLNENLLNIKRGKPTKFNIEDKKNAKQYLIEWLQNQK